MTGFSKLKKVPTGLSATYGPVSLSVSLSTEAIARSSVFADLMRQQTDAAIARMAEHLQRPMVFVHPAPKEDDGFEIRMLAWANTIAPLRYGTFLVDYEPPHIDPLDVKHDGLTLRELLVMAERSRREVTGRHRANFSAAQRAAVSAHWSAELRAKVSASKERDRNEIRCDLQDEP